MVVMRVVADYIVTRKWCFCIHSDHS